MCSCKQSEDRVSSTSKTIWTESRQLSRAAAYLSSAFALVDDLQRVLSSRAVLHAFPHHSKVAVAQHSSHLVAVGDVGRHGWNLVEQDLNCGGGGKKTHKVSNKRLEH